MDRNIKVIVGSVLALALCSYFVDSPILNILASCVVAVLAFFGAATVCLVSAPLCVPAISVGAIVFLTGLGFSTKSAVIIVAVTALIIVVSVAVVIWAFIKKTRKKDGRSS